MSPAGEFCSHLITTNAEGANPPGNAQAIRTAGKILALESETNVSTEGFNFSAFIKQWRNLSGIRTEGRQTV